MNTSCPSFLFTIPRILFLVVWGWEATMETFLPHMALRRVDFPEEGLPTIATTADFIEISVKKYP